MPVNVSLTSRERVRRALEQKETDRVPRHESFWRDTIVRWREQGLVGGGPEVLERLGGDIASCTFCWPEPFPGGAEVVAEDAETRTEIDTFGAKCRFWKNRNGTPEHLGFTCTDREVWDRRFRPGYERNWIQVDTGAAVEAAARARRADKFLVMQGIEPFEMLRRVLGDEGMSLAFYDDPEWVQDICRLTVDQVLANYQALLDAGVDADGIWTYGDIAYTQSTFCSPDMYREQIWPWHVKMVEWARARGLKFIYHTDGDIRTMLPHLLAAGFDALQPLECKANMDIRELVPQYGDKVTFFGNIDVRVLGTNDLERIEAEIAAKMTAGKSRHCYICHSDHSVPPDVTWETYQGVIDLIKRHGDY